MILSLFRRFKNHHVAGLHKNFKEAQSLLKRIFISPKKTATTLPWYLVIGRSQSGKTTLLSRSDLEYIHSERLIHKNPPARSAVSYINWWVTRKSVFVDVPGYYLNPSETSPALFPTLLALAKRKNKIAGVIFTVDIGDLLPNNKTKPSLLFEEMRAAFTELSQQLKKPFLIYLAITHTDKLLGFKDFFADLGLEERSQPWGISFPVKLGGSLDLANAFNQEFDLLLKRVHERLIWRLHHERDIKKRQAIYHFPLQVESLKTMLSQLIYQVNELLRYAEHTQLRGVYFLSGSQQGEPLDCLHPAFASHFEVLPAIPLPQPQHNQGYFIRDLLKETIFFEPNALQPSKALPSYHPKRYRFIALGAVCTILATLFGGWTYYQQKIQTLAAAKEITDQYQLATKSLVQTDNTLTDLVPTLDHLRTVLNSLTQQKQSQTTFIAHAKQTYQQGLQTKFLPALTKALEQQLQNNHALDAAEAYTTLKAYLMLQDTPHLQPRFLTTWLSRHQQTLLPQHPELENTLEALLMETLALRSTPSALNASLIADTRRALTMMPEPLLAYLILKNNYSPQKAMFVETLLNTQSLLSSIYNPLYFDEVYNSFIPSAVNEVNRGNWVIGNKSPLKKQDSKFLTKEVRDLFIADYARHWEEALEHLKIVELKELPDIEHTLQQLSSANSPLVKLPSLLTATLKSVNRNDKLATLTPLLATNEQQQTMLTLLRKLHADITKITQSTSMDETAFLTAKQYAEENTLNTLAQLQSKTKALPTPVKNILFQLSEQSWKMILQSAHRYVNTKWQTSLIPFYRDEIENRYPLATSAEKEISLNHFSDFFAPLGLLDKFFTTYLKPFVETEGALWHWKKIYGLTLGDDQRVLIEFERASLIRTMFFGKGSQFYVPFSLKPLALQTNLHTFEMEINGQSIGPFENDTRGHHLVWPGNQGKALVKIHFEDAFGKTLHHTLTGPWAWFRLLHQSTVQALNDTQHFELTVDIDNHAAKYQLVADNPINPFVLGIIEQFRSPSEI